MGWQELELALFAGEQDCRGELNIARVRRRRGILKPETESVPAALWCWPRVGDGVSGSGEFGGGGGGGFSAGSTVEGNFEVVGLMVGCFGTTTTHDNHKGNNLDP